MNEAISGAGPLSELDGEFRRLDGQAIPFRWPDPIDLAALASHDPQPPGFIVQDWLPCGYCSLFAGHGGVGKSEIALNLAACLAAGTPWAGIEVKRCRVLYLSCEDRANILHWRLTHICQHEKLDLAKLSGNLNIVELVGHDTVLWDRDPRTGYALTAAYRQLLVLVEDLRPEVIIVDGTSDTFGGNENSRSEVKRFVNALVPLVPPDRGAVLMIGHVSKPAALNSDTRDGYSGSTAWHNAVRARWYLYPETTRSEQEERPVRTGTLRLELQKSNLGRIDQTITFRWDEDGRLFVPEPAPTRFDLRHQEQTELAGIRHAMAACEAAGLIVPAALQGQRTAFLVLSQRPEFPPSLRGLERSKKQRFARHLETLRHIRHIDECSYRRSNRHYGGKLQLTSEGRAECAKFD